MASPTQVSQDTSISFGISDSSRESSDQKSTSTVKISKTPGFSFMEKRQTFRLIVDGIDQTPDDIIDIKYPTMMDTFSHAAFEVRTRAGAAAKTDKGGPQADTGAPKVFATTISLDDIKIDTSINTEDGGAPDEIDLDKAPSAFYLPKEKPIMSYPPSILVVFKETETLILFELPSFSFEKGTAEANAVEEANEFYQYITVGKGRNRKMVVEETQTEPVVIQSRHTLAVRPDKKNAASFASLWDMHDTYEKLARRKAKEEPDEMVLYQSADSKLLRKKKVVDVGSETQGKTFEEIGRTHNFFDAVLLTERVLAAKAYSDAQKNFRGLMPMNPLSLDLVYCYTMKPLWTLECEETAGRPIITMEFNPKNKNILAVSYGKFGFADHFNGYVAIWCTKNPIKPERLYEFDDPLTAAAFSSKNPNWLACGFANGDVLILDVTAYSKKIVAKSTRDTNPCFEPIWTVTWRTVDKNNEYVMTTCQDGRVNRFTSTKTHDFICTPMMRLSTVEGSMKGLEVAKTCLKVDVPINRHPAAHCMMWHPHVSHIYFVGTDEGCIHKCSKNYLNQHMDVFRAHAGPVYALQSSPYMENLMVTCGADGAIRLWVEGIDDVIMTLNCQGAVYDAAFCPINATIILTISTNVLSIWDLRRKNHIPCAEYKFPAQGILSCIRFNAGGDSVFVSDSAGRVHTFHLEDTPIAPFYQRKMLDDAIKKALCTRPHLLKQLEKMTMYREKRNN